MEQEKQKSGSQQTVQELRSMLQALEKEAVASRSKAAKHQRLVADVEAAKAEARTAVASAEVAIADSSPLLPFAQRQLPIYRIRPAWRATISL